MLNGKSYWLVEVVETRSVGGIYHHFFSNDRHKVAREMARREKAVEPVLVDRVFGLAAQVEARSSDSGFVKKVSQATDEAV